MNFDLHIGVKTEKAACAFLHLASASSSVPPVVVIRLPRHVKAVTRSRLSPAQLMVPVFAGHRILISLVLAALTLSPTLAACSCISSNFCRMWAIFWLRGAVSSASSGFRGGVSWVPVSLSPGTRRDARSSAARKRRGLAGNPVGPEYSC